MEFFSREFGSSPSISRVTVNPALDARNAPSSRSAETSPPSWKKLGLEHVVLIGHSMGGDVIVEAARQLPGRVEGLVWVLFKRESYFAIDLLEDEWEDIGRVDYYRRPLTVIAEDLYSTGFWIERLLEPQPTADFKRVDPAGYERLIRSPWFLFIRARNKGRLDVSR